MICAVCARREAKRGNPRGLCGKCRASYWHHRADLSHEAAIEWAAERARQVDRQQPKKEKVMRGETHHLKTWPAYFEEVEQGRKTFEVRLDDRGFEVGDLLHLEEWDPKTQRFTGRETTRLVTYILRGNGYAVQRDFVVMAIAPVEGKEST